MTALIREIQYLVLPNASQPYLLARVRWPDVYQAISPARPDWQDDPGLFDLPYAETSTAVTGGEAARIATEWGAQLPADDEVLASGPSLIRRMPSNWSELSMAERRAWAIVDESRPTRVAPVAAPSSTELIDLTDPAVPAPPPRRPVRRRRGRRQPLEPVAIALDLPEQRQPVLAAVDHA